LDPTAGNGNDEDSYSENMTNVASLKAMFKMQMAV
jgi:hypothetical protein